MRIFPKWQMPGLSVRHCHTMSLHRRVSSGLDVRASLPKCKINEAMWCALRLDQFAYLDTVWIVRQPRQDWLWSYPKREISFADLCIHIVQISVLLEPSHVPVWTNEPAAMNEATWKHESAHVFLLCFNMFRSCSFDEPRWNRMKPLHANHYYGLPKQNEE